MGKFQRELTYTGEYSKLTNIQKKRVSSISREADTTTWLGDDVLGVEVIKYDINGYNVNIRKAKNAGDSTILYPIFNPFPCKVKMILNNYIPGKQTYKYLINAVNIELYKNKNGVFTNTNAIGVVPDRQDREWYFMLAPGFNLLKVITPYYDVLDVTCSFYPLSLSECNDSIKNMSVDLSTSGLSFVCNRKSLIESLGTEDTTYIRLAKLDAFNDSVVFRYGDGNSLYKFIFISSGDNKKTEYKYHRYIVNSFNGLYKVLSGSMGTGTLLLVPYSGKNAILNNWETPTGKPALSYTTYTKDSPEIAKLTELYNSIK